MQGRREERRILVQLQDIPLLSSMNIIFLEKTISTSFKEVELKPFMRRLFKYYELLA